MITAFYSSVLDFPVDRVWSLVRDFNNYPRYIDGVIESEIEDGKRGDEVGAVRRFNYQGTWIRQRLLRHSDEQRLLTYGGMDPFAFPADASSKAPGPTGYEGTIQLHAIVDGDRTFIEWPVVLDPAAGEDAPWHDLFMAWIPEVDRVAAPWRGGRSGRPGQSERDSTSEGRVVVALHRAT